MANTAAQTNSVEAIYAQFGQSSKPTSQYQGNITFNPDSL